LFSLGVIVFRWLTGKLPFDAPDLVGKMLAVTTGPRPSALALNPSLPPAVDAWVARALAIDPQARFQSGPELRDALAAALAGNALPKPKPAAGAKPRALADAQQAFAAAFRSAAGLLKRFTTPVLPKTDAPAAKPAPEPVTTNRNTLWLDSSELEPVAGKRNTLWLDSSELEPVAGKRNTLWLDSSELEPVTGKPPATPPTPPEAEPPAAKGRVKARASKAKPLSNSKARVTQRKQRKGPFRKSSR
jgi:serine/threonine protein kinase